MGLLRRQLHIYITDCTLHKDLVHMSVVQYKLEQKCCQVKPGQIPSDGANGNKPHRLKNTNVCSKTTQIYCFPVLSCLRGNSCDDTDRLVKKQGSAHGLCGQKIFIIRLPTPSL